jgi:hypothetical protein
MFHSMSMQTKDYAAAQRLLAIGDNTTDDLPHVHLMQTRP